MAFQPLICTVSTIFETKYENQCANEYTSEKFPNLFTGVF